LPAALGPVSVASEAVHQLLSTSTYSGNDVDRVNVQGGYVSKSVTWQDLKVPYLVNKHLAPNHAVLTLSPGITLLMADSGYIDVGGDDTGLHAVGTATAPITITSLTKTAGIWESIVFDNTINSQNALDHCTIEYGGGGTAKGWGVRWTPFFGPKLGPAKVEVEPAGWVDCRRGQGDNSRPPSQHGAAL